MPCSATRKRTFLLLATLAFIGFSFPVQAQDSCFSGTKKPIHYHAKNYLSAKSLLAPTLLISYGFTTLVSPELQELNKDIRSEVQEDLPGFATTIDNHLRYIPAAGVYLLDFSGIKAKHRFMGRTIIFLASTILTEQLVTPLKHATHQLRPDGTTYNAFPSGHTATAFIGAEFMHQEMGDHSVWYSIAGYTAAGMTGLFRVLNNRHWFSDVLAGAGIGMLSTKCCYWLYSKFEKKPAVQRLHY